MIKIIIFCLFMQNTKGKQNAVTDHNVLVEVLCDFENTNKQ